ncbi:MAG: IS66 family insertion sequence element accessory protein TnpB [Oscillospiraceae bacterium]|nr:IS66 family insertion sequence element accessory protein TnpB [Oscillospiraceae bacterium]
MMGYTDFRCSIDGLAEIVQGQLHLVSFSIALFLFCGDGVTTSKDLSGKVTDSCFCTSD